jgi:hypothetical protein
LTVASRVDGIPDVDIHKMVKKAFDETVGSAVQPAHRAIRQHDDAMAALQRKATVLQSRIDAVEAKMASLGAEMLAMKAELLARLHRIDTRVSAADRTLRALHRM